MQSPTTTSKLSQQITKTLKSKSYGTKKPSESKLNHGRVTRSSRKENPHETSDVDDRVILDKLPSKRSRSRSQISNSKQLVVEEEHDDDKKTPKKAKIRQEQLSEDVETPVAQSKIGNRVGTPKTPATVYQEAKAAFRRCATPSKLIGRAAERKAITGFLEFHLLKNKHGSLYISGCPGTGKTAMLNEVMKSLSPMIKKVIFLLQPDIRTLQLMLLHFGSR